MEAQRFRGARRRKAANKEPLLHNLYPELALLLALLCRATWACHHGRVSSCGFGKPRPPLLCFWKLFSSCFYIYASGGCIWEETMWFVVPFLPLLQAPKKGTLKSAIPQAAEKKKVCMCDFVVPEDGSMVCRRLFVTGAGVWTRGCFFLGVSLQ